MDKKQQESGHLYSGHGHPHGIGPKSFLTYHCPRKSCQSICRQIPKHDTTDM